MDLSKLAFVLAAVAAPVDWWAVWGKRKAVEYVAKPAVMVFLIVAAVSMDPSDTARRDWFVAALVFSLLGDVFLMIENRFVPGLASFLLAHLAYIVGFHYRPEVLSDLFFVDSPSAWHLLAAAAVFGLLTVLIGRRIIAGARRLDGKLEVPVTLYMVVITVMVVKAVADGHLLAAGGAILFYVSDALIGVNRFVHSLPWMPLAIIVAYHLAQMGLVASLYV